MGQKCRHLLIKKTTKEGVEGHKMGRRRLCIGPERTKLAPVQKLVFFFQNGSLKVAFKFWADVVRSQNWPQIIFLIIAKKYWILLSTFSIIV